MYSGFGFGGVWFVVGGLVLLVDCFGGSLVRFPCCVGWVWFGASAS